MSKKTDEIAKDGIENYGDADNYLSGIGLSLFQRGFRLKSRYLISVTRKDVDLFQVLAIYCKLKDSNISRYSRNIIREFAKKLLNEKDPLFMEAKKLHKELREQSIRNSLKNENQG